SRIGHSNLLALIDIRCSLRTMQGNRQHLAAPHTLLLCIITAEPGNDARLVMVAPENWIPSAAFVHSDLPVHQDPFQFIEIEVRKRSPLSAELVVFEV